MGAGPSHQDHGRWRRLLEASAAVTGSLELDEVLRRVIPLAAEAAGAEGSSVILHDAPSGELVMAAASGPHAGSVRGRRFPDTAGIAGEVLRTGAPVVVVDARLDRSHLREIDRATGHVTRSLMAAPLTVGSRRLGVVEVVNRLGGGSFEPSDLESFSVFCNLIAVAVDNARLYRLLAKENEGLRRVRDDRDRPLIADSPAMRRALDKADRAAGVRSTVLVVGETGTGKEQVALRIHRTSPRADRPFIALNCGALPATLVESELFGHERGAFTGADRRRLGRFELADGGTLFLDEIGELSAEAQVKLLRVLQEREFHRLGGSEVVRVDVRLVAATHRDLEGEVRAGRFREDLFFRVNVVPIRLPPLRERPEDVEPLARHFLESIAADLGRAPRRLLPESVERLSTHRWPGNVRELQNLVERLLVLGDESPIAPAELDELIRPAAPSDPGARREAVTGSQICSELSLWDRERELLVEALERAGDNQSRAARMMGISREQLRTRMKRYGLLPRR